VLNTILKTWKTKIKFSKDCPARVIQIQE